MAVLQRWQVECQTGCRNQNVDEFRKRSERCTGLAVSSVERCIHILESDIRNPAQTILVNLDYEMHGPMLE